MSNINRVCLVGRLGRQPELRVTPNGVSVANFSIAVDRRPNKDGSKETDWIDIVVFSQTAEACSKYLDKGSMVGIEGRLQVRTWETKDTGEKRKAVEVIADNVQFLTPKGERSEE
jgi:single-strand DNA-binding protein